MTEEERLVLEKYHSKMKKKKGRYSKFTVMLIILLNVAFTGYVFYVFKRTGSEPETLITAWFGFTTVQLWSLAGIKKKKIEKENEYSD